MINPHLKLTLPVLVVQLKAHKNVSLTERYKEYYSHGNRSVLEIFHLFAQVLQFL